jgi:hypothetical protein
MIGGCTWDARLTTDRCHAGVIYKYVTGTGYQRVQTSESLTPGQGYWILLDDVMDEAEIRVDAITASGE